MKILFLTDNFPPEVNAPASRTFEHTREWVKAAHDVTVITCAPNFPQGKLLPGYRNKWRQRDTVEGIKLIRVWSFITANEGFLKRILDHLSFALTAFLAGLRQPADVIVATSPQFFTTFAAFALSKLKRRPWVFEVRDIWPAAIRALGFVRHERILAWLELIELALYRDAAMVVVVTESFKGDLVARGIDPAKIEVVTNGVDLTNFAPRPRDVALERELALEGKFIVGYIGTHGHGQKLGFIVDAAAAVTDPQVHFLFVGAGAERAEVVAKAKRLGLANMTFLETVPKEQVTRYLALSDIMLVPLRKTDIYRSVIPSKIFEAAGMERPILIGVDGEARAIVEKYGAGRYYEPEDLDSFAAALTAIRVSGEDRAVMVAGCRGLAEAYDRKRLAAKMLGLLERIAPSAAGSSDLARRPDHPADAVDRV
ncbi:MAG: glycosyltransferase family 4 protein [Sphingomicrobium sp.]